MKKRILSMVVAVILMMSLMPITAFASGNYAITNGTPESDQGTNHGYITIDKTSAGDGETVTITVYPSSGYKLKSLTGTASNGPEYVEMNMGTGESAYKLKWATKNIGATTVAGSYTTSYGDLFQWGSVETLYTGFPWTSATDGEFTWKEGKSNGFIAANREYTANDAVLPDANDVVKQTIGGNWRMPTDQEFRDLVEACGGADNYDKVTKPGKDTTITRGVYWCDNYDGVAGVLLYDGTNKLFFPSMGMGTGTRLATAGTSGYYWSSTINSSNNNNAFFFAAADNSVGFNHTFRNTGLAVRPVTSGNPTPENPTVSISQQSEGIYTFTMPNFPVTISAAFEEESHTHHLVKVDGQAATETASGWQDYYECKDGTDDCHAYFEDEAGNTSIPDLSVWKAEGGRGYIAKLDAPKYGITVSSDGNGTASASVTEAASGTNVTLTATPSSGYVFDKWEVVSGGITISNNSFTMPANAVEVKAKFKLATPEPGPTPDPEPDPEPQRNYLESLDEKLEEAIKSGNTDTIYWDEGDALPNYVMKLLFENPNLSFDFKYTYEGVEHEIYIGPGQATNDDIEWYGPLWLLAKYGEKKDISAIPIHGVYVIQKGDTLNELAKKFNTTVDALLSLNPAIKNKNLIYPGTTLNY